MNDWIVWTPISIAWLVAMRLWRLKSIRGGWVVNTLASNATDDGGWHPTYSDFRDLFLESIQPPAQRYLKWSVWHYRNWLRPVMSAVITGKNYLVTKMDRYNTYQTEQLHACIHFHTVHTTVGGLCLAGWLTTKKGHPLLWFDASNRQNMER